jgi:curved DNA-binding protein CbpA
MIAPVTAEPDPYAVLGVQHDATTTTIAAAYRALARRHHPDVSGAGNAERRMAQINAAWTVLRDPARRAAWDQAHAGQRETPTSGWRRGPHGEGAAGPPPGNPRGSVLDFGRHMGWSLGEIARVDPGYLQWLATHRDGGRYRAEIEAILAGMRPAPTATTAAAKRRRGLFR